MSLESRLAKSTLNSGFAEQATYTPSGKTAKKVQVVVIRDDPMPQTSDERGKYPYPTNGLRFYISNDLKLGHDDIKEGFDKISMPLRVGDAETVFKVTFILENDLGMYFLQAEK